MWPTLSYRSLATRACFSPWLYGRWPWQPFISSTNSLRRGRKASSRRGRHKHSKTSYIMATTISWSETGLGNIQPWHPGGHTSPPHLGVVLLDEVRHGHVRRFLLSLAVPLAGVLGGWTMDIGLYLLSFVHSANASKHLYEYDYVGVYF